MKDKYDEAVEYLTENPKAIWHSWGTPTSHPSGCLFQYVTPTGDDGETYCGCLTLIRGSSNFKACTPELTEAIRADKRIPEKGDEITVEHLPIFAEWQRRIDKELNRV